MRFLKKAIILFCRASHSIHIYLATIIKCLERNYWKKFIHFFSYHVNFILLYINFFSSSISCLYILRSSDTVMLVIVYCYGRGKNSNIYAVCVEKEKSFCEKKGEGENSVFLMHELDTYREFRGRILLSFYWSLQELFMHLFLL